MTQRFESSQTKNIAPETKLECKICWHVYDPAEGDEVRQIPPNTPFNDLPDDWHCPNCDGEKYGFMVLDGDVINHENPKSPADIAASFKAAFIEVWQNKMQDIPFCNRSLNVDTIGFKEWNGRIIGVLVTPWCMNLVLMPKNSDDWSNLKIGDKRIVTFPSGDYEFIFNNREDIGDYFSCSIFSPMEEFPSQLQAVETARAVSVELFIEENKAETDRADEIEEMRNKELEANKEDTKEEAAEPKAKSTEKSEETPDLSRRTLFTGRVK